MTINEARKLLDFIITLKKKGTSNDDVVWKLANNFNINENDVVRGNESSNNKATVR